MKKIISVISAAAVMAASVPTVCRDMGEKISAAEDAIKIMCIGDSITDGYFPEYAGSYRKFIYRDLTGWGQYNIDMVGTKDGGYTPTYTDELTGEVFEYDNENVGYSGYAVAAYSGRSGIYEKLQETDCLKEKAPDIVTLQIGTNNLIDNHDMEDTLKSLDILFDYILENIPEESILIVSSVPHMQPNRTEVYDWFSAYRHSPDWQTNYTDEEVEAAVEAAVDSYNESIRDMVEQRRSDTPENERQRIFFIAIDGAVHDLDKQLADGVHPNNEGYRNMGNVWSDYLDQRIRYSLGKAEEETPAVTTTAVTTTVTTEATIETATAVSWMTDLTTTVTTEVTTEPAPEDEGIKISDMLSLSRYLINTVGMTYTEARLKKWDVDGDGKLTTFDLVLMRQMLTDNCIEINAKAKEKFGDDFSLFVDGRDVTIIYPEDCEWVVTSRVQGSNAGSHVSFGTTITEWD